MTRLELVEAATETFYRSGYRATSYEQLAWDADVPLDDLRRVFPSIEDLLADCVKTFCQARDELLLEVEGQPNLKPRASLEIYLSRNFDLALDKPAQVSVFTRDRRNLSPVRLRPFESSYERQLEFVALRSLRCAGPERGFDSLRTQMMKASIVLGTIPSLIERRASDCLSDNARTEAFVRLSMSALGCDGRARTTDRG
jgi:AcrR family transcriptional regulator